jgi:hypothetical protein
LSTLFYGEYQNGGKTWWLYSALHLW